MKVIIVALVISLVACGDDEKFTIAQLQDPNTCLSCHTKHYQQWSGSMHAYASTDPVFIAMNKRGQRETNGELGLFCINCHAPMAVANKTITEANVRDFDLSTLSPAETGITCYFCHNAEAVTQDHNNGLKLAMDQTMRGGAANPVESPAHHSKYDVLQDSERNESELCGSCHDVVTPKGVALERTFLEWKQSVFATEDPQVHLTCGNCHMEPFDDVIADGEGLTVAVDRRPLGFHDHLWAGIDQALTPFPERDAQTAAIAKILEPSIAIKGPKPRVGTRVPGGICLDPPGILTVRIDSFNVGHSFPTGVAHDRRAWLEVIAFRADQTVVFESGVVPDNMDPEEINDPNLVGIWERAFKDDSSPAHFFHEVASTDGGANLIKGPVTFDPNDVRVDHSLKATFNNVPTADQIDRITARVRMRALPYEVLRLLEASGDLDPSIKTQLKTLEVASSTWLRATKGQPPADNTNCNPQ